METTYQNILLSLHFLQEVVNRRLQVFFSKEGSGKMEYPLFPKLAYDKIFFEFLLERKLVLDESILLLLALVPHVNTELLDRIIRHYLPQGGEFPEIGGVKGTNHRGMLPTGETALFIIAGNDLKKRLSLQKSLFEDSILIKENSIWLEQARDGEPSMSGRLIISPDLVNRFITGNEPTPKFGPDFPAKRVTTSMTWNDAIFNSFTLSQIDDIQTWLKHNSTLMNDNLLKRKLKPGYKVLFYGPSGTGKTLCAALLGRQFNKEVYRIDLSQIVSKYIGETEKNLEKVFSKAENKEWILFFDEADALFGKRTGVQNAHDRYANQEVSYLLQRLEDYPGLIILASNLKSNIDSAFLRRFHAIVHFPVPNPAERRKLWETTLPESIKIEPGINWQEISEKYELNGASILHVIHYASLKSVSRKDEYIRVNDLLDGIRRELRKEERSMH